MPIFILLLGYKESSVMLSSTRMGKMIYNCYQGNSNVKNACKLSSSLITRKLEYENNLQTEP